MAHIQTPKTSRISVRVTDVERGKLAEEAGRYGTISNVIRAIIRKHCGMGKS